MAADPTPRAEGLREALKTALDRLDPNGSFWDYTTPDGDSHVLLKNEGLAARLAAALAASDTAPGLDVERLARAIADVDFDSNLRPSG